MHTLQMEGTCKILRRTIHTFFHNYYYFASVAALLALPASASVLLSQALLPSYSTLYLTIQTRVRSLFEAAGFPSSVDFFVALNLKFSQTMFSYAFTLPFTLTFLVAAKASVVHVVCRCCPRRRQLPLPLLSPSVRLYPSLLSTHVCSSFAVLSANAAIFSLLFIVFNVADVLGIASPNAAVVFSTAGAVVYSVVLAHVTVAGNLAMVVSGVENRGGYLPLLKAFLLIKERAATALSLALLWNVGMASVEALFQYRVMKPYRASGELHPSFVWEAFSIAYIHSIVVVLDVVATCVFFKSCSSNGLPRWEPGSDHRFELLEQEEASDASAISKCQEIP